MSHHVAGMDALETRRMMFAQPIVEGDGYVKRYVAMTDEAIYYEDQPQSGSLGDRFYRRVSRTTGKVETLKPSGDSWNLYSLERVRTLGDGTVLMSFRGGDLWAVRDGSTKAEKLGAVYIEVLDEAVELGGSLYFSGELNGGRELFRTDGTARGTRALPELRKGTAEGIPANLVAAGNDLLFTASTDKVQARRMIRWDGKAFRPVEAMAGKNVDGIARANGKVVVTSGGRLSVLSSDYKTATPFAESRATAVTNLSPMGKGIAFVSAGGVYRSDLTTRGTIRLGDAPVASSDNYATSVTFDPAGYLRLAYNGTQVITGGSGRNIGGGLVDTTVVTLTPTVGVDSTAFESAGTGTLVLGTPGTLLPAATLSATVAAVQSTPAVWRLESDRLTKLLDGSFDAPHRVGNATYFISGVGSAADGTVVRIADDGTQTSVFLNAQALRSDDDGRTLAFAGGDDGKTLYVVDPASKLGTIHGIVFSDDNLNRKVNGSDDVILGGDVFADYNRNGRRDKGEPTTSVGDDGLGRYGEFVFTGLRPGTVDLVAEVGGNYRGSVAVGRVTVTARGVAEARLLATPLFSSIRVEVFDDANGNGVRDKNESAAPGYKAYLDLDGDKKLDAAEPTATGGTDGAISFARLRPALYKVRVKALHDDDMFTTPSYANVRAAGDGTRVVSVGVKHDPMTASVRGTLTDLLRTPNFSGVAVELLRGKTVVATTTATSKGVFRFDALAAGDYGVRIKRVGRYASAGGSDATTAVKLAAGVEARPNVAVYVMPVIRGVAFVDADGDGERGADEPVLAGAHIDVEEFGTYEYFAGTSDAAGRFEIPVSATGGTNFFGRIGPADDESAPRQSVNVSDADDHVVIDVPFPSA